MSEEEKMNRDEKDVYILVILSAVVLFAPLIARILLGLFYGEFIDTVVYLSYTASIRLLAAIFLGYRLALRAISKTKQP